MDKNLYGMLDENWLKAEKYAQDFINLSLGNIEQYDPHILEILLRKACAIVGIECLRRIEKRNEQQALLN